MIMKVTLVSLVVLVQSVLNAPVLPPVPESAARARFVVNSADWASVSTISSFDPIKGYPFSSVLAMSDGELGKGSGEIYLVLTVFDMPSKDMEVDNRGTVLVSLAQSDYCKVKKLDAMDPRCARVMLTGKYVKVDPESAEHDFANKALIARHPDMVHWPANHGFYIVKLEIEQIAMLDYFGGAKFIPIAEYFDVAL